MVDLGATVSDVTYMSAREQMWPGDPERSMGNVFRVHVTFEANRVDNLYKSYVFVHAHTGNILLQELFHATRYS